MDSITGTMDSLNKLQELVMAREAWRVADHGVSKGRKRLSNCTELKVKDKDLWEVSISIGGSPCSASSRGPI